MKIVRYAATRGPSFGVVEGQDVFELSGDIFGQFAAGERVGALEDLSVLVPVQPSKIVAVGKNYSAHVAEMAQRGAAGDVPEEPVLFLKPPTALLPDGGVIELMPGYRTDFEAELCLVMAKEAYRVTEDEALSYVLGYTCGNDVSNRQVGGGGQWTRGKGYNTFCPLGPVIETNLDPDHVRVQSRLNGEPRQNASTETMIFKPAFLVSFISNVMTLLPGDVIMTGTPEGVGSLQPGDVTEVEVEGIGTLRNTARARE
ncbi:MAG TPA: fumarylacetoacetate hydrolase family protein [Thermomicrobiaceae bacterium]|nr:fumarylacetoacetate hydrolase family protein [Thermomicrobiaceae bacterium]